MTLENFDKVVWPMSNFLTPVSNTPQTTPHTIEMSVNQHQEFYDVRLNNRIVPISAIKLRDAGPSNQYVQRIDRFWNSKKDYFSSMNNF